MRLGGFLFWPGLGFGLFGVYNCTGTGLVLITRALLQFLLGLNASREPEINRKRS